jgi:quercetin dioxygenase-like cupin family protein
MSNAFEIESLAWQTVRPDVAQGVFGKTILDEQIKVVLTRLAPGGKFVPHRDKYGHLLYFTSGEGYVRVGDKQIVARAGVVVRIMPGEEHEYGNTGTDDLMLVSMNIPA